MDTEALRMKSMEAEIDELRAALVSEVKSAETESQRRVQEDADIRKKLEVSVALKKSFLFLFRFKFKCLSRISNHDMNIKFSLFFSCVSFSFPSQTLILNRMFAKQYLVFFFLYFKN